MSDLVAAVVRASVHRFIGRLGRDPEARYFESGSCVINCRIAVNRAGARRDDGQEPDWFKLEIWGETGQAFADGCVKGDLVEVTGRIKSERWTDRSTGEERSQLVVVVDQWQRVEIPQRAAAAAAPAAAAPAAAAPAPAPAVAPAADDIPF